MNQYFDQVSNTLFYLSRNGTIINPSNIYQTCHECMKWDGVWRFYAEYLLILRAGVIVRTNASGPIHSAMCTARIAPASGATVQYIANSNRGWQHKQSKAGRDCGMGSVITEIC